MSIPIEQVWFDSEFTQLSVEAKLVFVYVLHCPHRQGGEFLRLPNGYVTADLRMTEEATEQAFQELINKGFLKLGEGADDVDIEPEYWA